MTRLYDGAKASWTEGVTLALVNPEAAGGRAGRLWSRLESTIRAGFPGLTVRMTEAPGSALCIARDWSEANPGGTLLVAGGDGSLHEAVNGAAGAGPFRLGVIPLGSGNDFARNAGIPLDPETAVRRLRSADPRQVDLGQLSFHDGTTAVRRTFLNSTSLGVSARANALARASVHIPRGRLHYGIAGLRAAWSAAPRQYRVSCGERLLFEGLALNLTVANGASFGGGMPISPRSSLSDAMLELIVLGPMRRIRLLAALARLQRGTHLALPELRTIPVREPLQIELAGAGPIELDGEELEAGGTLTVEVLPGRVTLLNGVTAPPAV